MIHKESLEIVVSLDAMKARQVWIMLKATLMKKDALSPHYRYYGETLTDEELQKTLVRSKKNRFSVESDQFNFHFSGPRVYNHSLIVVEGDPLKTGITWQEFVEPFLTRPEFSQAWVANWEYEYWQNLTDPKFYAIYNREMSRVKLIQDHVFGGEVVDVSEHPGRRVLRQGYVEAIGSPMWFGERFWHLTGSSKETILMDKSLNPTHFLQSIRIEPWNGCFDSDQGVQKDIQNRLRELLYPKYQNDSF